MSRGTWLVLWTAAAFVLLAMIELRPLWGLGTLLFLSLFAYNTTLIRIAMRKEIPDETQHSPDHD